MYYAPFPVGDQITKAINYDRLAGAYLKIDVSPAQCTFVMLVYLRRTTGREEVLRKLTGSVCPPSWASSSSNSAQSHAEEDSSDLPESERFGQKRLRPHYYCKFPGCIHSNLDCQLQSAPVETKSSNQKVIEKNRAKLEEFKLKWGIPKTAILTRSDKYCKHHYDDARNQTTQGLAWSTSPKRHKPMDAARIRRQSIEVESLNGLANWGR